MIEAAIILLSVLIGVFVQRLVGFGMPIVVLPAVLIFFQPTSALVITLLTGIFSAAVILYELRSKDTIDFKIIKIIIPSSIVGVVIGSYILTVISKEALQIFLGLCIIASLNLQRYFLPKPKGKFKVDGTIHFYGLLSGFFKTTVGLSAAPLLVWLRFYIMRPNQVRILLSYYFLIMNIIAIASIQIFENTAITNIPAHIFILSVPIIILANFLGSAASRKVNEVSYAKLVHFVLMVAGVITIFAGLNGIFN